MNPQMDVLYMQSTGHVLGIFTRASEPAQMDADASAFVGDGLNLAALVSGQSVTLVVPASLVGIFRTARNWRQIFTPGTLYASGLPSTPTLAAPPNPTPTVTAATSALPNFNLTFTAGITGTILILAVSTAGGAAVQFSAPVTATQTSVTIPVTGLTPGNYEAFIFVPNCPVVMQSFSV